MSARVRIEAMIRSATDSVLQQVADTDDSIGRAVIGRSTNLHLVINSSFLYRDRQFLKTLQSPKKLVAQLAVSGRRVQSNGISILDKGTIRVPYRFLSGSDASTCIPLTTAVSREIDSIGDLIFILIGTVKGLRPFVQEVETSAVQEIHLMPSAILEFQKTKAGSYTIRKPLPVEDLLNHIHEDLKAEGGLLPENRQAVAKAYDKMLDAVTTDVEVPRDRVLRPVETILGKIAESLRRQTSEYENALAAVQAAPDDRQAMNEVLRIAYNFSSDVLPLIYLFVSVCDLKPLVFWSTVKQHWSLYRAFFDLPWSALGRKEGLTAYQATVSQARSYAFHHVLPFDSTIEVNLSGLNVHAERIRLFAPFGERQDRGVTVTDQKLVDVLTEFSRAKERPVSLFFWQANLKVMKRASELTEQMLTTLLLIHEARREFATTASHAGN